MNTYTEDALIEQTAIALFQPPGWEYLNCYCPFANLRRTRDLLLPKLISFEDLRLEISHYAAQTY